MTEVTIETVDLVKRYPISLRGISGGRHREYWGRVGGFKEIFTWKKGFIQALNKVNLKVYRGEVFGLLGPNGAGKTTLIKILCTLVLPDGGEAYVNGYNVVKQSSKVLRNLQAVLGEQHRGFEWRLNLKDNLEFYATLYGLPRSYAKKRIEELLEFMGLKDRSNDMYQRLSTGMARKLQLCRALLLDIPILLFDEPTAGLDPTAATDFRQLLRRLAKSEGKTIFISTHNMWEAQSICDRVAIINKGEIIACDTTENLRRYVSPEKHYSLILDGEPDGKLKRIIDEFEGLNGVKDVSLEFGSLTKIIVKTDENFKILDMMNLIAKHCLNVRDMETYEPSLEEIFIKLVKR
ncbi:ABC transporter ATP-binding protein [Candidatus Bathyarchaeota archaeon]|nr:ABC transporter ATP-binding protein [Candidatus Bathyarchaeota archaeon]MBS7617967.1 ABC transporter ATP-binding protein [Candidatus Bathyarchaeota archaeon]